MWDIVLEQLADGTKTTEELRRAMCETYGAAYSVLRNMRADQLIQSSNARASKVMKWRLKPEQEKGPAT